MPPVILVLIPLTHWSTWSNAKVPIVNGGAIRPGGLLFGMRLLWDDINNIP